MLKLSYSTPFHNILNYASTANIEEVMKFYNPGDKTFETDFRMVNTGIVWRQCGELHFFIEILL